VNARPASTGTFLLFVYGTLKKGGSRHQPLSRQRFLGNRRTRPRYALYHMGNYPAMVEAEPGDVIEGELYEVEARLLDWLDTIEGVPDWFELGQVELENGEVAWAYFYRQDTGGCPRIPSGRWDNSPSRGRP